ncbi:MAG: GTP 3',8-cyclase MoaA [Aeromonas sp.]
MPPLEDALARKFGYLRLSLTEVCNFRCQYCLPDGYQAPLERPRFLNVPEISRLARTFAALGTRKVRLTGGEPSLRKDLPEVIATLAATPGIEQIAMTTNGYRLNSQVATWRAAGLTSLNISVDSLDPRQFHAITGENKLTAILRGIDAALAAGVPKVKINVVLLKGLNDRALADFLAWIKPLPLDLRFIELMQTGGDTQFSQYHQSGAVVREQLLARGWLVQPRRDAHAGPAELYAHPDSCGQVGLIMPYSPNFCASCNRLRVSAQGQLHLCLFGEGGIDLRHLLAHDEQQALLAAHIRAALQDKPAAHQLAQGLTGATVSLAQYGG